MKVLPIFSLINDILKNISYTDQLFKTASY